MIDIGELIICRVIIHDVPKHMKNDTSVEPIYSENESVFFVKRKLCLNYLFKIFPFSQKFILTNQWCFIE
jgi:hypothetical protein